MNELLYSACIQLEAVQSAELSKEREKKSQLLHEVTKRLSKQVSFQRFSKKGQGVLQTDLAPQTVPECRSRSFKTPGAEVF